MSHPNWVYKPGTNIGMTIHHSGAFKTKKSWFPSINEKTGEEEMIPYDRKIYNQGVWVWTGYRWTEDNGNKQIEIRRDHQRHLAGRIISNNEWR